MTVPLAAMSHGQWDFVSSQIKLGLSSLRVLLDGFGRPLAPSEFCGVRHSKRQKGTVLLGKEMGLKNHLLCTYFSVNFRQLATVTRL